MELTAWHPFKEEEDSIEDCVAFAATHRRKPSQWCACLCYFAHGSLFDVPSNKTLHRADYTTIQHPNSITIDFFFFGFVITNLLPFTLFFIPRHCLSHSVGEHLEVPSEHLQYWLTEKCQCVHDPCLIQWDDILPVFRGCRLISSIRLSVTELNVCWERPCSTRKTRIWSSILVVQYGLRPPGAEMEQKPQWLTISDVSVVKATTVQS